MSPLNTRAVEQNLGLDALACQCRDDALDSLSIRQFRNMDGGFPANAVDDFIARCRVGLVSLPQPVSFQTSNDHIVVILED